MPCARTICSSLEFLTLKCCLLSSSLSMGGSHQVGSQKGQMHNNPLINTITTFDSLLPNTQISPPDFPLSGIDRYPAKDL